MIQATMVSFDGVKEPGTGSAAYSGQLTGALTACPGVTLTQDIVLSSQTASVVKKAEAFLRAACRGLPYEWSMMIGAANEARLAPVAWASLLVVNGFNTSYFLDYPGTWPPYIYIMHDRHELQIRAVIKGHAWPQRFLLNAIGEHRRCRTREAALLQKAAAVITVSYSDYAYALRAGVRHAVWIPPSFDPTLITPRENSSHTSPEINIGMLGNTSFFPNLEGMRAVIADAWPHQVDKRLNLVLAGKGTDIFSDASRNIRGLGYLPELSSFWDSIDILLVPNLNASGIGVKLCEAVARNVPVLTTRQGARGLPDDILRTLDCVDDITSMGKLLSWDWLSSARHRNYVESTRAPFLLPYMQQQLCAMLTRALGCVPA